MARLAAFWGALGACVALGAASSVAEFDDFVAETWEEQVAQAATFDWVDGRSLAVGGRAFPGEPRNSTWYSRFPSAAFADVRRAVWDLSLDSAGMYIEFESNSTSIGLNYSLLSADVSMYHFPSTGVAGSDLYAWDVGNGLWRWVATTRNIKYPVSLNTMVSGANATMTRYRLHLPTYNAPVELQIGVLPGAYIGAVPLTSAKPIVHYGTSICQGAVASRPGMAYTNIVSRNLSRDVLNFGFSGNGIMETAVAKYFVQVDAAAYIIDCLPNMQAPAVTTNAVPLVQYIRKTRPSTPIVLVEGTTYGQHWISEAVATAQDAKRAALRAAYNTLIQAGDKNLYYVTGGQLLATGEQGFVNPTVAGTHPSDLGMISIAKFYTTYLPKLLGGQVEQPRAVEPEVPIQSIPSPTQARGLGNDVVYTDLRTLGIGGRFFNDTAAFYNRLPAAAQGVVREAVWTLSEMNTGMWARFSTNATAIAINMSLARDPDPLWHMPQTGTSGVDLYRYDPGNSTWRWVGTVVDFSGLPAPSTITLADDLPEEMASYLLYLPLRNTIVNASIGVDRGYALFADDKAQANIAPAFNSKPVVWYGTSINQGGVASRAGQAYTNILTRRLQRYFGNFGFAGNGVMETSVAQFITTIDAALFVIDCLPNMDADSVAERTIPLVQYFRKSHPTTPIVLSEGTQYGDNWFGTDGFLMGTQTSQEAKRQALRAAYNKLVAAGDANLHYVEGPPLFFQHNSEFVNPTVGGTHPSDLGQYHIADYYTQLLPTLLKD